MDRLYYICQNEKYIFDYTLGGDGGVLVLKIFDCALIKTA